MIFQLFRNLGVDKSLCEACDIAWLNRAVWGIKSPFVPPKIPLDPGLVATSGRNGDLGQAKPERMQEMQASQSLCHDAIVEPSLLPALCRSRLRVEDNQPVDRHLHKKGNAGNRRIYDD